MSRRGLGAVILGVWLVAVGSLIWREYLAPARAFEADVPLNVSPGATYFRITLGDSQIGFLSSTVDTLQDTVRAQELLLLRLRTPAGSVRIDSRIEANLDRALRLRSLRATMRGTGKRAAVLGTVEDGADLRIALDGPEGGETVTVPFEPTLTLPSLIPVRLAFTRDVEIGEAYTFDVFDPLVLDRWRATVAVQAESTLFVPDSATLASEGALWEPARWDTVPAWRVRVEREGLAYTAWVDRLGQLVSLRGPTGFVIERTAFEIAYENFRRGERAVPPSAGASNVIPATAVAAGALGSAVALDEFRVVLGGVAYDDVVLDGDRQRLAGDTLIIRRETEAALEAPFELPDPRPEFAAYRTAAARIPIDDPRVEAQARQIVGREDDPVRVAELVNTWVYENLDKEPTAGVRTAAQLLESRRGDADEHLVVFLALARAAGLSARPVAGLVHIDGRFYYHAWPEVSLGAWVPVDPTLGQFPADAGHIRLAPGRYARPLELLPVVGRLTLEVVTTSEPR